MRFTQRYRNVCVVFFVFTWPVLLGVLITAVNRVLMAVAAHRLIVEFPPAFGIEVVVYGLGIAAFAAMRRSRRPLFLLALAAVVAGLLMARTASESGWNIGYQRRTAIQLLKLEPQRFPASAMYDLWGRRMVCKTFADNVCLVSLGADGLEGGFGYNADIFYCSDGKIYCDNSDLGHYLQMINLDDKWGGAISELETTSEVELPRLSGHLSDICQGTPRIPQLGDTQIPAGVPGGVR